VANGPHTETRRDAQCGAHLANEEKEEVCEMDEEVASEEEEEEEREKLIRRRSRRRRVDPTKPAVIFALVDKNRTVFRVFLLMTYVSHKTRLVKLSPPPRRRKDAVKSGTTKSVHKEWPQLGNN
jgi:hypothetical protein